ncbi:accessory gene regulator B family protein [Marinicrinis sediminis]|uniref:Accessory gene regulator B family protein n=1 Tax=Marinicrinis sediminis TaxID=1652465 RepID=A0ABW5R9N1_9BACL
MNPDETASVEIMAYSIMNILQISLIVLISLMLGFYFSDLSSVLFSMIIFVVLRIFGGGHHFNTMSACIIASILIVFVVPYIQVSTVLIILFSCYSFIIHLFFAPNKIIVNSLSDQTKMKIKIILCTLIVIGLVFQSSIMTIMFLIQSFFLIPYTSFIKKQYS